MTVDYSAQLPLLAPLLAIVASAMALLLLEAFSRASERSYLMPITLCALGVAMALEVSAWRAAGAGPHAIFGAMLEVDRFSIFLSGLFIVGAALTALMAPSYMREHRFEFGEFYALLLLATAGMMMLAAASDLLTIFLGVETMSLAVYVLTGSWRRSAKSSEAAMKYFLVGAFATAILVYGIALLYGTTGSTNLRAIAAAGAQGADDPLFLVGMLLVTAALGFKMAAVPFHMWAPDAYEGAPTPVTAFMAAAVKAAAFATTLRIFGSAFGRADLAFGASGWASVLSVLAILTMTVGNLGALRQDNVKRMLAYSSIAHAGYLLVGVVATSLVGAEARGPILYYLLAYTFTTIGAFGMVAWLGRRGDERLQLDDWAGLASRHPAAALAMTIFLLSLGGFPPTAGFFGKFYIFRAALGRPGLTPLVIIAVLNSVVSVYYYLRVVTAMYFREPGREARPLSSPGVVAALVISAVATLAIGILPTWFIETAAAALLR